MVSLRHLWALLLALGHTQPVRAWTSNFGSLVGSSFRSDMSTHAPEIVEASSGKFLYGGGAQSLPNISTPLNTFVVFDAKTNISCNLMEDFPELLVFADGMVLNGLPTVCGGFFRVNCYNFDPERTAGSRWMAISGNFNGDADFLFARMVSFSPDQVLIVGGVSSGETYVDEAKYLNSSGQFVTEFTLPQPLAGMCVVRVNSSHILVAGGITTNGVPQSQTFFYDQVKKRVVQDVMSMNMARGHIRCESRMTSDGSGNREIVVVGGVGSDVMTVLKSVEIFDITTGVWRLGPAYPLPALFYGLTSYENNLYVVGASPDLGNSTDYSILKLTPNDVWENVTRLDQPRVGHVTMTIPEDLVVCS